MKVSSLDDSEKAVATAILFALWFATTRDGEWREATGGGRQLTLHICNVYVLLFMFSF